MGLPGQPGSLAACGCPANHCEIALTQTLPAAAISCSQCRSNPFLCLRRVFLHCCFLISVPAPPRSDHGVTRRGDSYAHEVLVAMPPWDSVQDNSIYCRVLNKQGVLGGVCVYYGLCVRPSIHPPVQSTALAVGPWHQISDSSMDGRRGCMLFILFVGSMVPQGCPLSSQLVAWQSKSTSTPERQVLCDPKIQRPVLGESLITSTSPNAQTMIIIKRGHPTASTT